MPFPFHKAHMVCMVQKKLNLTKTVRKLPIDENLERAGHYIHDDRQIEVKYDDANWVRLLTYNNDHKYSMQLHISESSLQL